MARLKKTAGTFLLAVLLMTAAGCDNPFEVGNLNNPELEDFTEDPTVAAVRAAVQGLQIGMRDGIALNTGYVAHLGILGRESFTLDGADPRFVGEMVGGDLNPGSGAFGGSNWFRRYRTIKTGQLVLEALPGIPSSGLADGEKAAIRGFTKTITALQYLFLINTRWDNGIVWDIVGPEDEPASFISRTEAFSRISALLDEALVDLNQADGDFPFDFAPGLAAFGDPASFAQFNRALKARVAVYREEYPTALEALNASFLDPDGDLGMGPAFNFSSDAGDQENLLATDGDILAHPSFRTDAQMQPDGSLDRRVLEKTVVIPERRQAGVVTNLDFTLYQSGDDPIPVIRNEELILLMSEALWFTDARQEAVDALNGIRERAGGLAPLDMPATTEDFVTALLRERRFSLMFEGGHRWIDHRRFGRLGEIEVDRPGDVVPTGFPVPRSECLVRGVDSPCGA